MIAVSPRLLLLGCVVTGLTVGIGVVQVLRQRMDVIAALRSDLENRREQVERECCRPQVLTDAVRQLSAGDRVHSRHMAADISRALRASLTGVAPGGRIEIQAQAAIKVGNSGVSIVPVSMKLQIDGEALLDTVRQIENLRPGILLTALSASPVIGPANAPPTILRDQSQITLSGYALVEAAERGNPP